MIKHRHPPWKLLKELQLSPKKKLGQNFLVDPSTADMIIRRSCLQREDVVVEIGAGLGALTMPLAESAGLVYAVEKDSRIAGILDRQLKLNCIENVIIKNLDIFDLNLEETVRAETGKLVVFGNLPYYISSRVLVYLLGFRGCIKEANLMFQKEVARRITASPGTKSYSRLSVIMQYYTEVSRSAVVESHLFWPSPKVDSEVLRFRFKRETQPPVFDDSTFSQVVKAAFGRRRKTLQNALSGSLRGISRQDLERIFHEAGVDPNSRAETLDIRKFAELANSVFKVFGRIRE